MHGLCPGITTDLAALVNRFLPKPGGIGPRRARGYDSASGLVPPFAAAANTSAARANNEIG